jgi:hypothetical protein
MRRTLVFSVLLTAAIGMTPRSALAGPYADDMAKCLVKSTSPEDRSLLIRWMFSAMALHPDVASMAAVTKQQRDDIVKNTGALFQRLMLDSCKAETKDAIQNEGPQTIQYAFQILGQVAARGLFTDPHVAATMADLGKSVDQEKFKSLMSPGTAALDKK